MKWLKIALAVIAALVLVLPLAGPVGPIPGFFIGGTMTAVPERWGDTSELHEIMLKVPGTLPRAVIIWVVDHDDDLHPSSSIRAR